MEKTMRTQIIPAAVGLAIAIAMGTATAYSAPIANTGLLKGGSASGVEQVHYRTYRHCHWRNGKRWCHGGQPAIILNFGTFGNKHHRRHNDHNKHDGMKKKH
jgi:hypothetical protein